MAKPLSISHIIITIVKISLLMPEESYQVRETQTDVFLNWSPPKIF